MKVLFVGESWYVSQTHLKGFDHATLCRYEEAGWPFIEALGKEGITVDYLPAQVAQLRFPDKPEALLGYEAVIFSDVGSSTFLLHPEMQFRGVRMPNRLKLVSDYVLGGGGFLMIGGYMSYTGIDGRARYGMTPIKDVLPVTMLTYDDRMEHPEGIFPRPALPDHPILQGISRDWPDFLGYNKLAAKPGAEVLLTIGEGDALLSANEYGKGRAVAFASDCVSHWGTHEFLTWESYGKLFGNIIRWLAKKI